MTTFTCPEADGWLSEPALPPLEHIFIFKTNIQTEEDKLRVGALLNQDARIEQWSVDTQDVDCVLRIVSPTLDAPTLMEWITRLGYQCSELV